jgi:hypothetical protein
MPGVFAGARGVAVRARRGLELRQLDPAVAIRRLQHRDVRAGSLEPDDAVHPIALDRPFALQVEAEREEERGGGREVVDHDADVLHALDRHGRDSSAAAGG